MNEKEKEEIDKLSINELLRAVRYAEVGDVRFIGEHGKYWMQRLAELRKQDNASYVCESKALG
jgi:hypothetical protein